MAPTHQDTILQPYTRGPGREELLAPQTQIVADREAYLGQGSRDIGRRISEEQVELFISADVAGSLQQEFSHHKPEFMALHDVGTSASLRLLGGLAGASGARVQSLSVRRQGHGVALAVLQFVEVPLANGTPVRVYSTDLNADSLTRAQVARVLMAYSRLGVLLVGELPPHAIAGQLAPLREALARGPWPNRDLLMVSLGSGTALAAQATQLSGHSAVAVQVTPHASKPTQVWNFIGGAWNRLQGQPGGERSVQTELALAIPKPRLPPSEAATMPMELDPLAPTPASAAASAPTRPMLTPMQLQMPAPAPAPSRPMVMPTLPMPMPVPGAINWQAYAERCAAVKGALSCCVFDLHSMAPMAHAGGLPAADRLARQGALLIGHMSETVRALGLGTTQAEATVSTGSHHLLLRPVPGHPGICVHIVIAAGAAHLTLARMQLERVEPPQ